MNTVSGAGRGADTARRRFRAWGRRQMYSLFSSLGNLLSHRLGTLMTVLVIGIAMMLPLGLFVTVSNLKAIDLDRDGFASVSVFLQMGIPEQDISSLTSAIDESGLAVVSQAISPEQGLQEFRAQSGFGQGLDAFEENPLPWVLLLSPTGDSASGGVEKLDAWLQQQAGVELVQVDQKWLQRLAGLLALGDAVVSVLTLLFSLAVVVIVANTIRMDVAARSEEIQVLSLVGAGDGFIRQPFLYSGFWYGLLGALLALLLLGLGMLYLQSPLGRLLDAYGSQFQVAGLGVGRTLLVLACGGLLGLLGAGLSVQRYLRQLHRGGLSSL